MVINLNTIPKGFVFNKFTFYISFLILSFLMIILIISICLGIIK